MSFIEDRKADLKQLKYLLKHKKDVYTSGRDLGAPRLQLLAHDWDKFKPSNWTPYRDYWFGPQGAYTIGLENRHTIPEDIAKPFREAAERHTSARDHHAYKHPDNPVPLKSLPVNVRKEILSDWHSLAKRTSEDPQDFPDIESWAKKRELDWMHKSAMQRKAKAALKDGAIWGGSGAAAGLLTSIVTKSKKKLPITLIQGVAAGVAGTASGLIKKSQVKRKNLPQLKKIDSQDIKSKESADPRQFKPVQEPEDYSGSKFEKFVKKYKTNPGKVKPPVVSKDNYIIDGHHRWLASLTLNKNINILRLNKSKKEYLEMKKHSSAFSKTENLFNIIKPEKLIKPERLNRGKGNIKNYISKRPTSVSTKDWMPKIEDVA